MAAFFGASSTAVLLQTIRTRSIPWPVVGFGSVSIVFVAWQLDYGYQDKTNRVNQNFKQITDDPKHWFVPLLPSAQEKPTKGL